MNWTGPLLGRRRSLIVLTDFFTRQGLKVLGAVFAVSFLLGGVTAIIGFTMVVDLMAGR
jgi:hypothetical protein